jgi:hypothetical protein
MGSDLGNKMLFMPSALSLMLKHKIAGHSASHKPEAVLQHELRQVVDDGV